MRVARYVRVSTQEQAKKSYSHSWTVESFTSIFCKGQSWEIAKEYKEEGKIS